MFGARNELKTTMVIVIVALMFFGLSSIVSSIKFHPKTHVYVTNNLPKDTNMIIHCKSKDDDLGEHTISFNETYTWSFHINYLCTTLFWCRIGFWDANAGKLVQGSFKIYDYGRDHGCGLHCYRSVQIDGIYFKNVLVFHWPSESDERTINGSIETENENTLLNDNGIIY